MNREKLIEALAATLWKVQSIDAGTPESVTLGRTPEAFANEHELTRKQFTKYAAAVLDLCGPKPLVWLRGSAMGAIARYTVAQSDFDDGCGEIWYILIDGKTAGKVGQFSTEEAAQAAAQSDADAAHWGNTGLGDLLL